MSDTGRESFTDKTKAAMKVCALCLYPFVRITHYIHYSLSPIIPFLQPDSEKSNTQHFQDKLKGNADSVASSAQPQSEKSYTQKMGDKFSSNSNSNNNVSSTFGNKAYGY